jgi:tripartite-type tricarboxylate transporter receptor subunit TctC
MVTKTEETMPWRALAALAAALLAATPPASASAQEWPARPVKIIVGFAPGSSADQLARLVGQGLSTAFKQQFYVEYRQGNSGSIAASDTARAVPDGYTLMIGGSGPHITVPTLNPKIGYDPMKDFTHIAMIAGDSYVLAANPSLGVRNIAGLVAYAKAHEAPLTSSSPGPGSLGQILIEEFKRKAGIEITHVPAPDSGLMEVIGNHINMTLTVPLTAGEQIKTGKVVGLAMSSKERNPAYPDIATFAEQGYPEITGATWFWITAPKNLPPALAEKLNGAVRDTLKLPNVRKYFAQHALLSTDLDLAATNAFVGHEVAHWSALAKAVGLAIQ